MEHFNTHFFWNWFTANHEQIRTAPAGRFPVEQDWKTTCNGLIKNIDEGLGLEVWHIADSNEHWLIITAHGNKELFALADAMVEQAPVIKGWTFQSLFPPLQPEFRLSQKYDLSLLNPLDLLFDPRYFHEENLDGFLFLYTEADQRIGEEEEEATRDLLYNLFGERLAGNLFHDVTIAPAAILAGDVRDNLASIAELPVYIQSVDIGTLSVDTAGNIVPIVQ